MKWIKRLIVWPLIGLGLTTLIALIGAAIFATQLAQGNKPMMEVPEKIVLDLYLDNEHPEGPGSAGVLDSLSLTGQSSYEDLVFALKRAAKDDRVVAVRAHVTASGLNLAQIQEVRRLISSIDAAGKKSIVFSTAMDQGVSTSLPTYYLAAAFDQIWLQPSGGIAMNGISAGGPYLGRLLDKLDIEAQFFQRKAYKSAAEMFTREGMSAAHREAVTALLEDYLDQMVIGVSADRGISLSEARDALLAGPISADTAMAKGLIDEAAYTDGVKDYLSALGDNLAYMPPAQYLSLPDEEMIEPEHAIALIHGTGMVVMGAPDQSSAVSSRLQGHVMGAAIRAAAQDDNIGAIVLRVDSPGGSYVASDYVWNEVQRARKAGKPVIASMGNMAASGGYFIAMGADRILAEAATLTGSIGVLYGKVAVGDALADVGITVDQVSLGDYATMASPFTEFSEPQTAALNRTLDDIYRDFTTKAAQGRNMSVADLEPFAQGRVWSGEAAIDRNLVDEIGGLSEALDAAKLAMELDKDEPVWVVPFPAEKSPFEQLLEALESGQIFAAIGQIMAVVQTSAALMETSGLDAQSIHQQLQAQGPQLIAPPVVMR